MTLPKGYKHTEIGILPSDWEVVKLGEIAEIKTGDSNREDSTENGGAYTFFDRSQDIRTSNRYLFDCEAIIVGGEGSDFIPKYFKGKFDLHQRSYAIIETGSCIKYLYYFIMQHRKFFLKMAVGSTVKSLRLNCFAEFPIFIPPLAEQEKIAGILSTWDSQIQNIESLITEKQNLKKGLSQNLLSGQLRFKEFKEDWEVVRLGEVCKIKKGKQLNKLSLKSQGSYPVINGGVLPSGYTDEFNTRANTITISEGGNSCGFINYIHKDFWSGGHCYTLEDLKIFDLFLFFALKYREKRIQQLRVGSGLPNIQKGDLEEFAISFPSVAEQEKIAGVLSALDSKIDLLKSKLNALKTQKQGLMQTLLTGKTRVKV